MQRLIKAAATVAAAAFLAAAAPETPAAEAPTHELKYPIFADWKITKYVLAPWIEPDEDVKAIKVQADEHLQLVLTFKPGEVVASDHVLGCTNANYVPTEYPPDYLFQGGLPETDAAKLAASYGLPAGNVHGFDLDCSTGVFSYHFADAKTLLLGYDDAIYTIERMK